MTCITLPAGQGLWLDDDQGSSPVEAAGEPGQSDAGGVGRACWFDITFLVEGQLFAQQEVFRCQGSG